MMRGLGEIGKCKNDVSEMFSKKFFARETFKTDNCTAMPYQTKAFHFISFPQQNKTKQNTFTAINNKNNTIIAIFLSRVLIL